MGPDSSCSQKDQNCENCCSPSLHVNETICACARCTVHNIETQKKLWTDASDK
jgi:hypothetical protein